MENICTRCEVRKVKYPFMTSLCQKCRAELGHEQKEVSSHEDVWKELLRLRIKVDILEKAITQMDKKV